MASAAVSGSTGEEEGEETVNTSKQIHDNTIRGARGDLSWRYTIPAKGENNRESIPGVRHFRTEGPKGDGCMFAMLGTCGR